MPAIDFPAAPAVNDEYSFEGRTWRWNGTGWEVKEYPAALLAGTAANPSLYFSGDPNTGIYSPGADQVAIAIGGSGKLFVDASGLIRILNQGTTSALEVGNGTNTDQIAYIDLITDTTYADYGLRLIRDGGANGSSRLLQRGTTELSIITQDAAPITFQTNFTERLRITSAGLVGIGTSAPSFELDVTGSGTRSIRVATTDTSGATLGRFIATFTGSGGSLTSTELRTGDSYGFLATHTNHPLILGSNGTERLRITSAGNVGIGTSAPLTTLDVAGTFNVSEGALAKHFGINAAVTPVPVSNGMFAPAGNTLAFTSGAFERVRIDSSGRLLVGTSSARSIGGDNFRFNVEGVDYPNSSGAFVNNSANANPSIIALAKSRGTSVGAVTIVNDGDNIGRLDFRAADGSGLITAATINAQVDGTPGTNDMPGRLVFSTTADGASSPTERLRITSAGVLQVAEAGNISVGTTTGTKIGTATTQKLGFYNATPVVQPAAVANATDAASVITQLNDLLAKLRTLGIIAT